MDSMYLDQHISKQFNEELEKLRTELIEMGGVVEQQLIASMKAMETADVGIAKKVLVIEEEIDQREVVLDQHCTEILARRQPAASDLRLVLSTIKITRDLERMGDEACKIAQLANDIHASGEFSSGYVELRHLAKNVCDLLSLSLDAFARYDIEKALQVMRGDRQVDAEYKKVMHELLTKMMENPSAISRIMNVTWALRALERIGDHARNISEHVVYLVHGKDVRHRPFKEIEKQIGSK